MTVLLDDLDPARFFAAGQDDYRFFVTNAADALAYRIIDDPKHHSETAVLLACIHIVTLSPDASARKTAADMFNLRKEAKA